MIKILDRKDTKFKKGMIPWNKGLKGIHLSSGSEFKKGLHPSPKTEFKKSQFENEKHFLWKGDSAGYTALHTWIKRKLGNPQECVYCGHSGRIEWASISHKAKRDINDYIPLCKKCHHKYDDISIKLWEKRRINGTTSWHKSFLSVK